LFLDEIGDMPIATQVKLLRTLENSEVRRLCDTTTRIVDVRVVAATHRDLSAEIAAGRFRQDLFYRLNVVQIDLPPLRERREDIGLLASYFLERLTRRAHRDGLRFSPEAMALLESYDYPGNVRELENAIEHAVAVAEGPRIRASDLPTAVRAPRQLAIQSEVPESSPGTARAAVKPAEPQRECVGGREAARNLSHYSLAEDSLLSKLGPPELTMPTERLYYDDSYTARFPCEIAEIGDHSGRPAVALTSSYFYPEGGGQEADRGRLGDWKVVDVQAGEDGVVWHVGEAEGSTPRPFDHMQQHTGQHALSAAFERVLGAATVSSHLGETRSSIEVALDRIEWRQVESLERAANDVIWRDVPVHLREPAGSRCGNRPSKRIGSASSRSRTGTSRPVAGLTHVAPARSG
jgi:hypothetical protein